MPLRGTRHSDLVKFGEQPYFKSLAELDVWEQTSPHKPLSPLSYAPRSSFSPLTHSGREGKLLVCHDYKGGYTESPSARSYTFNFWSTCDVFVYFSHHRITVPPPGWITSAHRQGVKILGTVIFEGGAEQDCLRLLVGPLPTSNTGPAKPSLSSFPFSPHYARVLADLAFQRGFDGYLLNFEVPLQGGMEQTRALTAWIAVLQKELLKQVGPHAETIWYDSVIFTGALRWQDRLNALNLPFFLPSTSIFTNYTWPPYYPSNTAEYFFSLDAKHTNGTQGPSKSLREIYTGVDVWGRGSHGGGGLGSYRALTHIDPASLGLSVALFGQAWTWETEQDKPGFNWDKWWAYEQTLWVGPPKAGDAVHVPDAPLREGEPECPHGPFLPIQSFFPRHPPPNPSVLAFHTTFCPGVGRSWWIDGAKVYDSPHGWTDVGKQTSLGNLVWPRPQLQWEGDEARTEALPTATSNLLQNDAWNGGSCLQLSITGPGTGDEDAFFRCLWLPIQSLSITQSTSYQAFTVFKTHTTAGEVDLGLSLKTSGSTSDPIDITPLALTHAELPGGWTKLAIDFTIPSTTTAITSHTDILSEIGFIVGFAAEDPSTPFELSITMGQLNVFPTPEPSAALGSSRIFWADFAPTVEGGSVLGGGILTWEVAAQLGAVGPITVTSPEDPNPVWTLDSSECLFPAFLHFNVYVLAHNADGKVEGPEQALFVGTTGLDRHAMGFHVEPVMLPDEVKKTGVKAVRFFVQGVTEHGKVLLWEQSVYVDVNV